MRPTQALHSCLCSSTSSIRCTPRFSLLASKRTFHHGQAAPQQPAFQIRRVEWPDTVRQAARPAREGDRRGGRSSANRERRVERNGISRRDRNDSAQQKRLKRDEEGKPPPVYATNFSKEEIENEERRPKRKVAVLFGYAGTGYKGLQLSDQEKTIEGDVFRAFVATGAISKANANDPKKSALVRCARTDKGVHAAGNVLSLKLIIEDENLVQKLNETLPPQIRIWSIQRTSGSFSAYQMCDSRIYEYLMPTHCFVPPHPKSFLGKKLLELAIEEDDLEGYNSRQEDVASFWSEAEEKYINPVLETLDPELRAQALQIIFEGGTRCLKDQSIMESIQESSTIQLDSPSAEDLNNDGSLPINNADGSPNPKFRVLSDLEKAVRALKSAYQSAKLAYRLTPARLARVRSCLSRYVGVHNFHNYTINKPAKDPSAKRVMKSFIAGPDGKDDDLSPTLPIHGSTEWLSLKVHGQSFMMHQIRKMVSLAALVVRCGTHEGRIQDTFSLNEYTIPTAPGLGLLLERPVFDSYNQNKRRGAAQPSSSSKKPTDDGSAEQEQQQQQQQQPAQGQGQHQQQEPTPDRLPVDFDPYHTAIEAFKQKEIYERVWTEGEHDQPYLALFSGLDNLKSAQLLYLTSAGLKATERDLGPEAFSSTRRGVSQVEKAAGEAVAGAGDSAHVVGTGLEGRGSVNEDNSSRKRAREEDEDEEEDEEEQADS